MSDPTILAFDTSGPHCAAALLCEDAIYGEAQVTMVKGQAEALVGVLEDTLAAKSKSFQDLDAIGVGIGPGNFTGIRISVSAARGLALSLGIPAIGVSTFEIMRDPNGLAAYPAEIVAVPAPRGQAYVQAFRYGVAQGAPRVIDPAAPPEDLRLPTNMRVRGFRAAEIARPCEAEASEAALEEIGPRIARITEARLQAGGEILRPAPLYVRPADAAPPRDPAPVILDDA